MPGASNSGADGTLGSSAAGASAAMGADALSRASVPAEVASWCEASGSSSEMEDDACACEEPFWLEVQFLESQVRLDDLRY